MATQLTTSQIIDQIALINAQVPGVRISYNSTNVPQQLTTFPCTIVLLGPEEYRKFGVTEFWIRVFVQDVVSTNPTVAYPQLLSLATAFRNTYALTTSLIGDRFIEREKVTTKLGFGATGFAFNLPWGNSKYWGFQVNLPLVSSVPGA
jgi:hypothetical protein